MLKRTVLIALFFIASPFNAKAEETKIAVAANFTAAIQEIIRLFEQSSGHRVLTSFGSTGKLYTQIIHDAPFDAFLAADQEHPKLLNEKDKLGQKPFTYAVGKLVLWSKAGEASEEVLKGGHFRHLAIANPKTAPYGAAALRVLDKLGLADTLAAKLVRGDNIAQTYQFVATGNAEAGFVALAQVIADDAGSRWLVPQDYYEPIRQDAILLTRGAANPATQAFMAYLQTPAAQEIIRRFGYELE